MCPMSTPSRTLWTIWYLYGGGVDPVVAAAGNMAGAHVGEMSVASWSSVLEVHLTGSFALVKAALPALRRSPGPSVVLTSSIAAPGIAGNASYGAPRPASAA